MIELYKAVADWIPAWLLCATAVLILIECALIAWWDIPVRMGRLAMARLSAPFVLLVFFYGLIQFDAWRGTVVDVDRGVALSRLAYLWLFAAIATILGEPLYRHWKSHDKGHH